MNLRPTAAPTAAVLAVGAAALAASLGAAGPASAADPASAGGNATLTVVHGIPNTPVDVYANGQKVLTDFTFKTVTNPLSLPAGSYDIQVKPTGQSATILSATENLTAGENVTVVANLTAAGKPALTPFVNDTSATPSGQARAVVRHTAAAPAVDVYAGSAKVISGLTNPNSAALVVPAGTVSAKVTLAGSTAPVIGPTDLPLQAGRTTVVYAVGSASGNTLTAVTQTYANGAAATAPTGVQAGSGGLADDGRTPVWPAALAGAGVVVVAVSVLRLVRR